jgi:ribonuclease VapC
MIVDASAVLAIVFGEPDAGTFAEALGRRDAKKMSVVNFLEAAIRIDSLNDPETARRLDEVLDAARVEIVPATTSQARLARAAYRTFGKGRRGLNFGDCFAYALARESGEPLLYKGGDFAATDIVSAL